MKFFILVLLTNNLLFIRDSVCPKNTTDQDICIQLIKRYFGIDEIRPRFPKYAKHGVLNFRKMDDQVLIVNTAVKGGIQKEDFTSISGNYEVGSSSCETQKVYSLEELIGSNTQREYLIGDALLVTVPKDVKLYYLHLCQHLSNKSLMKTPFEFCEDKFKSESVACNNELQGVFNLQWPYSLPLIVQLMYTDFVTSSFKILIENEYKTLEYALKYFTYVANQSTAVDQDDGNGGKIKPLLPASFCHHRYPSYLDTC